MTSNEAPIYDRYECTGYFTLDGIRKFECSPSPAVWYKPTTTPVIGSLEGTCDLCVVQTRVVMEEYLKIKAGIDEGLDEKVE